MPLLPVAFNLLVGVLFLIRAGPRRMGGIALTARCLPALALGIPIAAGAAHPGLWRAGTTVVFVTGFLITGTALIALGRSFAVLPAVRAIKTRGPYSAVRHPVYAGELLMLGACATALGGWALAALLPAFGWATVVRIRAEESLLRRDPDWAAYADRVRWRLAPGLW